VPDAGGRSEPGHVQGLLTRAVSEGPQAHHQRALLVAPSPSRPPGDDMNLWVNNTSSSRILALWFLKGNRVATDVLDK
jgi:hypothetical protein